MPIYFDELQGMLNKHISEQEPDFTPITSEEKILKYKNSSAYLEDIIEKMTIYKQEDE